MLFFPTRLGNHSLSSFPVTQSKELAAEGFSAAAWGGLSTSPSLQTLSEGHSKGSHILTQEEERSENTHLKYKISTEYLKYTENPIAFLCYRILFF